MGTMIDPFPHDRDCSAIWTMPERDIDAVLARDWAMVEDDFIAEGFFGLQCAVQTAARRLDHGVSRAPTLSRRMAATGE